jgi:hypothetical protein
MNRKGKKPKTKTMTLVGPLALMGTVELVLMLLVGTVVAAGVEEEPLMV